MRSVLLFVCGILVGSVAQVAVAQQSPGQPAVRLNHVALSVPDLPAALTWYSEKMGFHEVIRNTNAQGQLMSAYIQVSRDTFLEMQQANAQRPAGINHYGLEVADIKNAVATFRARGAMVTDPTPQRVYGWDSRQRHGRERRADRTERTTPGRKTPQGCGELEII